MTPSAGEIWLADVGHETRRPVFVISDVRFHRLAERAVIAPVLEAGPDAPQPWHVRMGDRTVAVNQMGTTRVERLLERSSQADFDTIRQVRRAVREIAG